jgi:hypothetical protein
MFNLLSLLSLFGKAEQAAHILSPVASEAYTYIFYDLWYVYVYTEFFLSRTTAVCVRGIFHQDDHLY